MNKGEKIYIAGHGGLVGSALKRCLEQKGYDNFVTRTHRELDLTVQKEVAAFFQTERPAYVFLAAAKVGGIHANHSYPAAFMYENLMIQNNVIHHAYQSGVKKLIFLGSSCIYPKHAPQPIQEAYLLTGALEPTNEAYAIAKIAGMRMCSYYNRQYGTDFISVMPTNLYGPRDNYDLNNSHVLPALIRKFHEGKEKQLPFVEIWGTGTPRREFLYVDDMAEACIFLMQNYSGNDFFNVGTGEDITILELARLIQEIVGYAGELRLDPSKPDGMARKLLDVSRIQSLGWKPKVGLAEGIARAYADFKTTWKG